MAQEQEGGARSDIEALRLVLRRAYHINERDLTDDLMAIARMDTETKKRIHARAADLVREMRQRRRDYGGVDRFLNEYGLATDEGVALMCLAEALLRIPDEATQNQLIEDKIGAADWRQHIDTAEGLFANASSWALMLTGQVLRPGAHEAETALERGIKRLGQPVIRTALRHAMRIMGRQFVMGRTVEEALANAAATDTGSVRYSYDMLGEAARTRADAARYMQAYQSAIGTMGQANVGRGVIAGAGISVKLSALHPHYHFSQAARAVPELIAAIRSLCLAARRHDIGLTLDAEEAERLDLSLDILDALARDLDLAGWQGLGLALQAYQKRAYASIDWLAALARQTDRRLMLRLVKGAYWDSEIKWAQQGGYAGYPVFTRKAATDVSYLACAKAIFAAGDAFYPQFATHNAQSLASIEIMAKDRRDYEFQRLYGMGEPLYHQIKHPVRIYAPVGSHEDLLPYLVRRLLENGANSSFVNRIQNDALPLESLIADPVDLLAGYQNRAHPLIPPPCDLYAPARPNSPGPNLANPQEREPLREAIAQQAEALRNLEIKPPRCSGVWHEIASPADSRRKLGRICAAQAADIPAMMQAAQRAQIPWSERDVAERAACLERLGTALWQHHAELLVLLALEAGKPLPEALAELREAIDFCSYYAAEARRIAVPQTLPGPTGEENLLMLRGRGVFACISPWNFPAAIFTGQCVAALVMGNAVLAKPAEATPLIAHRIVQLAHESGIPQDVLQLLPGAGAELGAGLLQARELSGICFTGSTATAAILQRGLAAREGVILPLIAETGGQNVMIVDSSALTEQVVDDVITSAFRAAGQRCSALRVLYLQEDIADKTLTMLTGAMQELVIGDPLHLQTDIGPVIDAAAQDRLEAHRQDMRQQAKVIFEMEQPSDCAHGTFVPPCIYEIQRIDDLGQEHFGPVLHVIRYRRDALPRLLDEITATGYGLTMGLHSRSDAVIDLVRRKARVGNLYINRNMVGAVVGTQPFGGEGLSGTGPKAGGPHYLPRFATERVVTTNTTASGGNTSLVTLGEVD